jgi:carboxylesterase type B
MSAALGQFIVVNIQYYLAGFGFLGGAEVQETGTLNAGLLDQRLDMQWFMIANSHDRQLS